MKREIPWAATSMDVVKIVSAAAVKSGNGMRVQVYWNVNKRCWSVQYRGRVVCHARRVELADARGKVSEAGRQRVLREIRKNVHAFIVGTVCSVADADRLTGPLCLVSYNPYRNESFQANGEHWRGSRVVVMAQDRKVLAYENYEGSATIFQK